METMNSEVKKVFEVKEESIITFFEKNTTNLALPTPQADISYRNNIINKGLNLHHLMMDNIFVKISGDLTIGQNVMFYISDFSNYAHRGKQTVLMNRYIYNVEHYDDVSLKMVLSEFKVNIVN